MKTILVLTGGDRTERSVCMTAIDAARAVGAHLEWLHVRVDPAQAAANHPHLAYAMGAGLNEALGRLKTEQDRRSAVSASQFHRLCAEQLIQVTDQPCAAAEVSATWQEVRYQGVGDVIRRARCHDLVVLARPTRANGLPPTLLEDLLLKCGRPVLIAPRERPEATSGTAMVCWNDSAPAARALGAALPLLRRARRVVVACVTDPDEAPGNLTEAVRQLAWHGVAAELVCAGRGGHSTAERLEAMAAASNADLLVMGGYGHGRTWEVIWGGCTQYFVDTAERQVLMMH